MKNSLAIRETGTVPTGIGRAGRETVEDPLKPGPARLTAPAAANSHPPFQPVSQRFPALEKEEVVFMLSAPEASQVNLAGEFNAWRPEATPLKNNGEGRWMVRLMLRSGQYEYRFVVDGRWIEDPGAAQRVANPHGGFNSVVLVPLAVETSIL
jgi:1,4-alpha-glucan branching enzyme